jgi:hypothetical protein
VRKKFADPNSIYVFVCCVFCALDSFPIGVWDVDVGWFISTFLFLLHFLLFPRRTVYYSWWFLLAVYLEFFVFMDFFGVWRFFLDFFGIWRLFVENCVGFTVFICYIYLLVTDDVLYICLEVLNMIFKHIHTIWKFKMWFSDIYIQFWSILMILKHIHAGWAEK